MSEEHSKWMGLYGAPTPKHSYLMGRGCGPYSLTMNMFLGKMHGWGFRLLRRWLGINNKMTKDRRSQFTRSQLVRREKREDGTEAVS